MFGRKRESAEMIVVLAAVALCIGVLPCFAAADAAAPDVRIEKKNASVVLYAIHRGPYDSAGAPISRLFELVNQNRLIPRGPISICYLNNPKETTPQHYLVEIRVPVGEEALETTGTLGEMTDVKEIPAMECAVVVKPAGLADPAPLYELLFNWAAENGYIVAGDPFETFLENKQGVQYAEMKTTISLPVIKPTKPAEATK